MATNSVASAVLNVGRVIPSRMRLLAWTVCLVLGQSSISWALEDAVQEVQTLSKAAASWPFAQESADGLNRGDYKLMGSHEFEYFGFGVYRASLWTASRSQPSVEVDWREQACLLSLEYRMGFAKEVLAKRSMQEMVRQRPLTPMERDKWLTLLNRVLVDVKAGDRLVAQLIPPSQTFTLSAPSMPKTSAISISESELQSQRSKTGGRLQMWYRSRDQLQAIKLPEINDAELAMLFMGIWLSDKTSQPKMRDALWGRSVDQPAKPAMSPHQWARD